jgi:hypothetical protein
VFDEGPFAGGAEAGEQGIEGGLIVRGKSESGEEVKGLWIAEVAAVGKATRDGREVVEADLGVMRLFFEDVAALVLGERPPSRVLSEGNECRAVSGRSAKRGRLRDELLFLRTGDVARSRLGPSAAAVPRWERNERRVLGEF